jgi:hypothetical protein
MRARIRDRSRAEVRAVGQKLCRGGERWTCRWRASVGASALVVCAAVACRDVLNVPTPAGLTDSRGLTGVQGAEALRLGAVNLFARGVGLTGGQVAQSGLLADEFVAGYTADGALIATDSRNTLATTTASGASGATGFDDPYTILQKARVATALARTALAAHAAQTPRAERGQMFALSGYTELLLAEDVCSGVPLGDALSGGGVAHGMPLTTDSLLQRAIADLDSALTYGTAGDTVTNLARIGLGRGLVDRGRVADAAAAVSGVPTAFAYAVELTNSGNLGTDQFYYELYFNATSGRQSNFLGGPVQSVADGKGGVGLDFISAHDLRMPIDSLLGPTAAGTSFYYPSKFPIAGPATIPLAEGKEARLIEAEAALASGNAGAWLTTLNALRADQAETGIAGLSPLADPGTDTGRVSLLFRERAFWLFGTGHRLGDIRRLVRQYGRGQATVFPSGAYPSVLGASSQITEYGTDVDFPLAAVEQANPNFHGCLSRRA